MELQAFLDVLNRGERVGSGSEVHRFISATAFEVMEWTAKLNSAPHELGEIQALFSRIIGKPFCPVPSLLRRLWVGFVIATADIDALLIDHIPTF